MTALDTWLTNYYQKRPQVLTPKTNIFGEYDMPSNIRVAFESLIAENEKLANKLSEFESTIQEGKRFLKN